MAFEPTSGVALCVFRVGRFHMRLTPSKLRLITTTAMPVPTCMAGINMRVRGFRRVVKAATLRAATLDIATKVVRAAVPNPIVKTAMAPAAARSIFQAMTNRNIAPVHGRIAMLSTSPRASRI